MKYRVVVSPSVFRLSYVDGYTDWLIVAWMMAWLAVTVNPHASAQIQTRSAPETPQKPGNRALYVPGERAT